MKDVRTTTPILLSIVVFSLLLQPAWAQYEDVVAHAKPAVVLIVNEMSQGAAVGTGFFIDAGGYIVTNRHVIEDANRLTVLTPDGKRLPASVVRYSNNFDAAIIKVAGAEFPTLPFGDSEVVRQGQEVLVLGYPGGFVPGMQSVAEVTVTKGIVSALRPAAGLIQIDAAINPGNSGGPVLNRNGEVIGVAVSRLEKMPGGRPVQQINYAVAVNLVRTLAVDLNPAAIPAPRSAQPALPSQPTVSRPVTAIAGRGIGQWTLDNTLPDFSRAYGPAARTIPAQMPGYTNYCWDQPPLCVVVNTISSQVVSLVASGNPGSVRVSVGLVIGYDAQIGDPESKVVTRLGRPEGVWQRPDNGTHWLVYDARGVAFVINDSTGLVAAISVFRAKTARYIMPIP
jgi:hypothetical protein